MLRLGPEHGPTVIVAPPLFEEANRTRAILVGALRRLADRGITGAIPDLPGQGESLLPTHAARLTAWRHAYAAAVAALPRPIHIVAVRGGVLVDGQAAAASRWHWSPMTGADTVRELDRQRASGGGDDYAGNLLAADLLGELVTAEPMTAGPLRIVRMESDPRPRRRHTRFRTAVARQRTAPRRRAGSRTCRRHRALGRDMRRLIAFPCGDDTLAGTLEAGNATTGLLIVSGGNEVRAGAHRGMAQLAARLAADGTPVFRYDRRGVGDSGGTPCDNANAAADLAAAIAAFRHEAPHLIRIVAFGNCDAATLLALHGRASGIDCVVLANPWIATEPDALPPAAAIRARYVDRLRHPAEWLRLLRGGVDMRKLVNGLCKLIHSPSQRPSEAVPLRVAISVWGADATVILAQGDATAIAFAAAMRNAAFDTVTIPTASHSFARAADAAALERAIREVIRRLP